MDAVLKLTEILKENTFEDYFIQLQPPTDNQQYNNAVANVQKRMEKRRNSDDLLKCPIKGCLKKFADTTNIKRHIQVKHFDWKLYSCTCGKVYGYKPPLKNHIITKHLGNFSSCFAILNVHNWLKYLYFKLFCIVDMQFECKVCLKMYAKEDTVMVHARWGHVMPQGKEVFWSPAKRQIQMRLFMPIDVTGCYKYPTN